jgi:hypothetical protein
VLSTFGAVSEFVAAERERKSAGALADFRPIT